MGGSGPCGVEEEVEWTRRRLARALTWAFFSKLDHLRGWEEARWYQWCTLSGSWSAARGKETLD